MAGRWALALVLVAILAGRVRDDARRSPIAALATVAVCSFIATSVFALSGVVLGDHALPAGEMMQVIAIALLWDVAVAPLLLPGLMSAVRADPYGRIGYYDDDSRPNVLLRAAPRAPRGVVVGRRCSAIASLLRTSPHESLRWRSTIPRDPDKRALRGTTLATD